MNPASIVRNTSRSRLAPWARSTRVSMYCVPSSPTKYIVRTDPRSVTRTWLYFERPSPSTRSGSAAARPVRGASHHPAAAPSPLMKPRLRTARL